MDMETSKLTAEGIIGEAVRIGAKMSGGEFPIEVLAGFSVSSAVCTIVRAIPWIMLLRLSLRPLLWGLATPIWCR